MKPIILSAGVLLLLSSACKKEVILVPQACMYADKINIHKGDTITFTNCSNAANSVIYFTERGKEFEGAHESYEFKQYGGTAHVKVFDTAGEFSAVLEATNTEAGSPIRYMTIPISVAP